MNELWKMIFKKHIESYEAIRTLNKNGMLDGEETALREHILLHTIIGIMKSNVQEVENDQD